MGLVVARENTRRPLYITYVDALVISAYFYFRDLFMIDQLCRLFRC